ncbi:MAG TPA: NAD(P)-dependent oxidoreductase [Verrucomicrobiae bacterium]|nr:NAD(P)-dependent oxidoreductase [Verrucomicrobiae bacterium]
MNAPGKTPWDARHAWLEVPRRLPPKRPAGERLADFREIYSLYDEATVRAQASRCIQCPDPLCVRGCPLANRIPEWLALAAEGEFLAAAEISGATSNLPEICGRICPQERQCEGACILNSHSAPVSIGAIEVFINEYAFAHRDRRVIRAAPNGRRVACVGSGPASLSCADELAKRGFAVTIFEAQATPGGLLRNGIPSFKLEKSVVERRVALLRERGVVMRVGQRVGCDVSLWTLARDFDAVFLGIGCEQAKPLDLPGEHLSGVHAAIPFLVQKNTPGPHVVAPIDCRGKDVVVLGGGDTAMDCLRTAIRSGAKSTVCVYRRDLENMPGSRKEYLNAVEEGAVFLFLTNPLRLEGDAHGNLNRLHCLKMELGEPDGSGRRKPRAVRGSDFAISADLILVAYGFDPVPFAADSDFAPLLRNAWGGLIVDEHQMTNIPGIFSGGDSVRGAQLVVHAVRDGRRAAAGIVRWLGGRAVVNREPALVASAQPE